MPCIVVQNAARQPERATVNILIKRSRNNLYCGITFRTLTEVDAIITESKPDFSIPIPAKTFPKNHYGDNHM